MPAGLHFVSKYPRRTPTLFRARKQAAEIFEEAQEGGKGFCGTYPEEEAELYVEQFTRCEPIIYADMEKEGVRKGAEAGSAA